MEIERKFLIKKDQLPDNLAQYPCHEIEQGYLCTNRLYASADRTTNIILLINQRDSWHGKNTIFL